MADYTADKAASGVQPRGIHAGGNTVRARFAPTATASAGDVLQCVKVPHGAIIDDVTFVSGPSLAAAITIAIGDGGSTGRYLGSTSASTTVGVIRASVGLGHQYSISADAYPQSDTIDVLLGTGQIVPATHAFDLIVSYHIDD